MYAEQYGYFLKQIQWDSLKGGKSEIGRVYG